MHLFVTGATGFLGSHFIDAALADGHHVTALRRPGSQPRITLEQQPTWCNGHLNDDWSSQLQACDTLVHLAAAGVSKDKDDWEYCFDINVRQSLQFWRAAIDHGVKNFLICGSCFEYGKSGMDYDFIPVDAPLKPIGAYASSKAAASMAALGLAAAHDLNLLIVRPFHLYGEGESETRFWPSLVRAAKADDDFPMTAGEQIRDFMHVSNAATRILEVTKDLKSINSDDSIVNLGSGRPSSLSEFASSEWARLEASGLLMPGKIPYQSREVMRYVPLIDKRRPSPMSEQAASRCTLNAPDEYSRPRQASLG
jgi:nucleoside-diphosphate-sugar epimerase